MVEAELIIRVSLRCSSSSNRDPLRWARGLLFRSDITASVMSFYEEQGLLYDVQQELERAYADYLDNEDGEEFQSYIVDQSL